MKKQILIVTDREECFRRARQMFAVRPAEASLIRAENIDEAKAIIRRSAVDAILLEPAKLFRDSGESGMLSVTGDVRQNLGLVRSYIFRHYAEPLTAKKLAALVSVTPNYLCRMFRSAEGMSFRTFLEITRLERAAALLRGTDKTIRAVAGAVGFHSASYFGRRFRETFGLTPTEYRRRCKNTKSNMIK